MENNKKENKNPFNQEKPTEISLTLTKQELDIYFNLLNEYTPTKIGRPIQDKLTAALEMHKALPRKNE